MRSKSLFLIEAVATWIDESRIEPARKLYFAHEISLLIFLVTFPILIRLSAQKAFLVYIFSSFFVIWICLFLWWMYHYSAKKDLSK